MTKEASIASAIADLDSQKVPNYTQTAKKHGLERTTLMRRHKGISTSRRDATSIFSKKLTDEQEEALLMQIRRYSERGFPPSHRLVAKLVIQISREALGEH